MRRSGVKVLEITRRPEAGKVRRARGGSLSVPPDRPYLPTHVATPQQKTNCGFSLALGLLLLIGAVAYISIQRLVTADRQVADALEFATALEGMTTRLGEAEGAVHGYLITGNRQYVARYDAAVRRLTVQLADLRGHVAHDAARRSRADRLRRRRRAGR